MGGFPLLFLVLEMANIGENVITLGLFESKPIVAISQFSPGIYTQKLSIQGNSLLSSVLVTALDPGASVKVNYYDTSAGNIATERYNLHGHTQIIAAGTEPDRIIVNRLHNKPNVEIVVAGGNATLGVYITVISDQSADIITRPDNVQAMAIDLGKGNEDAPNDAYPVRLPTVTDMTNRVRVALANKILETTWQYDLQPRVWSSLAVGGAAANSPGQKDPAYVQLSTGTASGDKVTFRTKRFQIYQPFRTHILTMAMILGDDKPNLVKRMGQYTNFNGWYFEQNGSNFYIGYRNNTFEQTGTIETLVERANWNIDKMDGTGPSGVDLRGKFGNALTMYIAFVWHGTQGIYWGFQLFDKLYRCHKLSWSATEQKTFARSALLPIQYEIENVGAVASPSIVYVGPNSFNIEGGEEREGQRFSIDVGATGKLVNSNTVPTYVLGLRPKLQFSGVNNRGIIIPLEYDLFTTQDIRYEILIQSKIANGSWISVDNASIAEYSTDFTLVDNGYVVSTGYIGAGGNLGGSVARTFESNAFVCIDTLLNEQLAVVVQAFKLSGNNATVYSSITWNEIY